MLLKRVAKHAAAAVVSPSPKKARRSKRQKSSQNDEHPHTPDNGKLFLTVELHNVLSPLDAGDRSSLVSFPWLVACSVRPPGSIVRRIT
jgi:hypothetical protein